MKRSGQLPRGFAVTMTVRFVAIAAATALLILFHFTSALEAATHERASRGNQEGYAVFPANWLEFVEDVYPVSEAPGPIRLEADKAIQALVRDRSRQPVRIEVFGATRSAAEKLVRYFVDHHGFPESRFLIDEGSSTGAWDGWVALRTSNTRLPVNPPDWTLTLVRSSLASPSRTSETYLPPVQRSNEIFRFRPAVGLNWFFVEPGKGAPEGTPGTGFIGLSAAAETDYLRSDHLEAGFRGSYFGSMTGLTRESMDAAVSEATLGTYFKVTPEPSIFGAAQLTLNVGYVGNWRTASEAVSYLPALRGLRTALEVSTSFDEAIRVGVFGGPTFGEVKQVLAGGYIRHRLFGTDARPWDVKMSGSLSALDHGSGAAIRREHWSSVFLGVSGSL